MKPMVMRGSADNVGDRKIAILHTIAAAAAITIIATMTVQWQCLMRSLGPVEQARSIFWSDGVNCA